MNKLSTVLSMSLRWNQHIRPSPSYGLTLISLSARWTAQLKQRLSCTYPTQCINRFPQHPISLTQTTRKMWSSQNGVAEDGSLLGCYIVSPETIHPAIGCSIKNA